MLNVSACVCVCVNNAWFLAVKNLLGSNAVFYVPETVNP